MKKAILFSFILLFVFSCRKRLDSFLFNPSQVESYLLDNYNGEISLDLNGQFSVPDSMIHQIEFPIIDNGKTISVHGIYVGNINSISTDTVILYCHGNKDHLDFYWPRQKLYANLGNLGRFGVLMFDYPGYGMTEGNPTETNMYEATRGALTWLKDHGLESSRLVMMGFSLGSAPVCEVAGHVGEYPLDPSKIILEAPFASAEILIQDGGLLSMPGSFLVDLKIDNATEIKKVNVPLLWIHGKADSYLTVAHHGQLVYDNKPGSKESVLVDGGEHETTPFVMGYQNYLDRILNFIE
jgi:pimeloyl-ACP methyl ester carboxylesterase